jgi:hypothetical protein
MTDKKKGKKPGDQFLPDPTKKPAKVRKLKRERKK